MFDAARHQQALARTELDRVVAEFDPEKTLPDQEELVLAVVAVPGKRAGDLDDLDLLAVERGHHLGAPMLGETRELFVEMEFFGHPITSSLRPDAQRERRNPGH